MRVIRLRMAIWRELDVRGIGGLSKIAAPLRLSAKDVKKDVLQASGIHRGSG